MYTDNAKNTTLTHARHKAQCTKGTVHYPEADPFPNVTLTLPVTKAHMQIHKNDTTQRERGEERTKMVRPVERSLVFGFAKMKMEGKCPAF